MAMPIYRWLSFRILVLSCHRKAYPYERNHMQGEDLFLTRVSQPTTENRLTNRCVIENNVFYVFHVISHRAAMP